MAIFGLKPWVNISTDIFNLLFLQNGKAFFRCKISSKTFSQQILPKKNVGLMAFFRVRPWVNPLGKMSIFRLFDLFVFIASKGVFQFYNIVKHLFLAYSAKKNLEKWPFLDQNHGLSPLGKCQFFHCLNVLFLQSRKAFFRSRIS